MTGSRPRSGTIGALVQTYVDVQCAVILDARRAIATRDEGIIHPVRVALRRLRATLRTFGSVYRSDERVRFARELRWAGLLLGEVRDLQVLADRFATEGESTRGVERRVLDEIDRDRDAAWDAAVDGLASARGAALFSAIGRWRTDPPFAAAADRPAARARTRVSKADARLNARLSRARLAAAGDGGAINGLLHDVRKAAKRHRYAVELAAPVIGERAEETIERGRALQDALGEHQDAVVALAFLQRIDVTPERPADRSGLERLIAQTKSQADDVEAVLRETDRLRG